ncbi:MAG: hypothetical protein NTV86_00570 [Planctomycetota bacterium]|nr:hypothetical protein [Planctomycetota bacterium]
MTQERPFRPGLVFHNGKLYDFDRHGVTVMRGWPAPLAWRKTRTRPWRMLRPRISLVPSRPPHSVNPTDSPADEAAEQREARALEAIRKAWEGFWTDVPPEVRRIVSAFPDRQWHIFSFLARCGKAAWELAEANPALAFCLANNWVFHKPAVAQPLRAARALLVRKQHQIAGWLGFPPTRSAARILAKIEPTGLAVGRLLYLRDRMADPETLKTLRHLPRIGPHLAIILTNQRLLRHVSARFLRELANPNARPDRRNYYPPSANVSTWLFDTLEMAEALHPDFDRKFDSLAELWTANQIFFVQMDELEEEGHENFRFPPPPIPGTDAIVPITTPEALAEEGRLQNHCARNYGRRVAAGESYFYRVLKPERATLSLQFKAGKWNIGEVKSKGNREVRTETKAFLERWLGKGEIDV